MALRRGMFLILTALVLTVPLELPGCGGGDPIAVFTLTRQP
ncbi:MAG: hypothetical protein JWP63_6633, partial [Candidatus Solibacter sp.]|nr:hypothetical protein [Candidatus Solibacter sp.]